jgi:hypothetical protein
LAGLPSRFRAPFSSELRMESEPEWRRELRAGLPLIEELLVTRAREVGTFCLVAEQTGGEGEALQSSAQSAESRAAAFSSR